MRTIHENETLEEASRSLLAFILEPRNWIDLETLGDRPASRPGLNPKYQRQVGTLRICASVDIAPDLEVFLRIAFRSPGLTPWQAVSHLEAFLKERIPLAPNTEWQVRVDGRKWIHFIRPYSGAVLQA